MNKLSVLFVYSGNSGKISPFIQDQAESLKKFEINIDYYPIIGKGLRGYLKNAYLLQKHSKNNNYDLIHAHYGLSGLVSNLQRKLPVVTTFHGSDVNVKRNRIYSKLASHLSSHSIFVSDDLKKILGQKKNCTVIPCGVDTDVFKPLQVFKKSNKKVKILFSSSFGRKVKNSQLAKRAVKMIKNRLKTDVQLLELKGYSRKEVAELMNRVDACLLTSFREGSPQFIKEAMACGCPCVATNVGDIEWLFGKYGGYYLCNSNSEDVAEKLVEAIEFKKEVDKTNGRERIIELGLDSKSIATQILKIYRSI